MARSAGYGELLERGSESCDGVEEVASPWPVGVEVKPSPGGSDASREVDKPVSDCLGGRVGPGEEVVGCDAEPSRRR